MLEGNSLLSALHDDDLQLILARAKAVILQPGHILYETGDVVNHTYFPRDSAVACFIVALPEGPMVETAMVGREGALGGIVSRGRLRSFSRSVVVHGGSFWKVATADLEKIKEQSLSMRMLFARYSDCLLAQVYQQVACNASHSLEQRLAKWLCSTMERTGECAIPGTQEDLAQMLGVGRSYASRVIQRFKQNGLLRTRRGGLEVLDVDGLKTQACGCNDIVNDHFSEVLGDLYTL